MSHILAGIISFRLFSKKYTTTLTGKKTKIYAKELKNIMFPHFYTIDNINDYCNCIKKMQVLEYHFYDNDLKDNFLSLHSIIIKYKIKMINISGRKFKPILCIINPSNGVTIAKPKLAAPT